MWRQEVVMVRGMTYSSAGSALFRYNLIGPWLTGALIHDSAYSQPARPGAKTKPKEGTL